MIKTSRKELYKIIKKGFDELQDNNFPVYNVVMNSSTLHALVQNGFIELSIYGCDIKINNKLKNKQIVCNTSPFLKRKLYYFKYKK